MITYEVVIIDSSFTPMLIPVDSFLRAVRLYNSISLDDSMIYRKELYFHDWSKKIRYRVNVEEA